MKVNDEKTEGVQLGAYKGNPPYQGEGGDMIKWCRPDEYIIILGIPLGESGNYNLFFEEKYFKCKTLLAHWNLSNLTIFGRAAIANSLIFSRFRYYAQSMTIPNYINEYIEEDVAYLLWSKEVRFESDEPGSYTKGRRWIKLGALLRPKNELGVGLLHWRSHIQALQAKALLRYLDGTRGEWKLALDYWFNRFPESRGAIFTTIREYDLTGSSTQRPSGLPRFFREALENFRLLKWERKDGAPLGEDEARAVPVWSSHLFTIQRRQHMRAWTYHIEFNRIQDIFYESGHRVASLMQIEAHIRGAFECDSTHARIGRQWIKIRTLLTQWSSFIRDIPAEIGDNSIQFNSIMFVKRKLGTLSLCFVYSDYLGRL